MIPASAVRVPEHTAQCINEEIRRKTERSIECHLAMGGEHIDERLSEIDREWDLERVAELHDSAHILLGTLLAMTVSRKWLVLPLFVAGCLLQHTLKGWCPLLPVLRRLHVRTRREIDFERYALKTLRGDFQSLPDKNKPAGEQAAELLRAQER